MTSGWEDIGGYRENIKICIQICQVLEIFSRHGPASHCGGAAISPFPALGRKIHLHPETGNFVSVRLVGMPSNSNIPKPAEFSGSPSNGSRL